MRNIAFAFGIVSVISCTPVDVPSGRSDAAAKPVAVSANGGSKTDATALSSPTVASLTAATNVTRHLPGTAITTASGKYVYLVQSDGTAAPFASASLAAASGYPAAMIITVTAAELYCYGSGDAITAALPAPSAGRLREGALVKEKGKTDTYAVSDGVAWPIRNGTVFSSAGYDFANVTELAAGSLAGKVDAVGNCVQGVACLDEEYLVSCAKEVVGDLMPTATGISTATATSAPSATATATGTATRQPAANVMRHLPGTAITTATGKYVYLVTEDGVIAPFATSAIVAASGYPAATVITVSADELYCYSRGEQITAPLPATPSGKFREGALLKENGKTDTYVVSGGVAWPIVSGAVFVEAGYSWDNVAIIAAGTLANKVDAVGNCVSGIFCLDEEYLLACGSKETPDPLPTATATGTATGATATATATVTATASQNTTATAATNAATATITGTATATSVDATPANTATATATQTTTTATTAATSVPTATATSAAATDTQTAGTTGTAANVPTATATVTNTAATQTATTVAATVTATATATATVTNQAPTTIDLSWVYAALGAKLCLNANYFAGGNKAVLLIWTGPGADAAKGAVAVQTEREFCWSFSGKEKGLYYFWADVPDPSCSSDICPRDAVSTNGAMYMTAPKAAASARKWLHCEPTGCDGAAYWDGSAFTPMGD